jgi:hypothetical protein
VSAVRPPERPDPTIINESIPLFCIERNREGFWVAQDCDGPSCGSFLFKASAVQFAKKASPECGLMFPDRQSNVSEPVSAAPLDWMVSAAVPILHGVADISPRSSLGARLHQLAIISPKERASKRLPAVLARSGHSCPECLFATRSDLQHPVNRSAS